ncbi:MAG: hypothetical protein V2A73_00210 [Pseudomonadota bacterium]
MMLATRIYHWRDPTSVVIGLNELRRQGLTPRGLLFIALDTSGETNVAIPDDLDEVVRIRVGDKLSLKPQWEGRYYHFDAIQRLPTGGVLWNGDRRLAQPGSAAEVAIAVAEWCKGSGARNVFLGCTSHQPGSWWVRDEHSPPIALHERGYADVVTTRTGLLARCIGQPQLYYTRYSSLGGESGPQGWVPVFESTLGNILMLERRVLSERLVLTCERGLIEVDLTNLPTVTESIAVELKGGLGVIGRVAGGAFAVTCGKVEPWGLADIAPALLVGAEGETLRDLARTLSNEPA